MPSSCKQHDPSLVVEDVAVQGGLGAFCWALDRAHSLSWSLMSSVAWAWGWGISSVRSSKEGERERGEFHKQERDSLASETCEFLGDPWL